MRPAAGRAVLGIARESVASPLLFLLPAPGPFPPLHTSCSLTRSQIAPAAPRLKTDGHAEPSTIRIASCCARSRDGRANVMIARTSASAARAGLEIGRRSSNAGRGGSGGANLHHLQAAVCSALPVWHRPPCTIPSALFWGPPTLPCSRATIRGTPSSGVRPFARPSAVPPPVGIVARREVVWQRCYLVCAVNQWAVFLRSRVNWPQDHWRDPIAITRRWKRASTRMSIFGSFSGSGRC